MIERRKREAMADKVHGLISTEIRKAHPTMTSAALVGTVWKSSGTAVKLNLNCSY
jgi:hypothetical protein